MAAPWVVVGLVVVVAERLHATTELATSAAYHISSTLLLALIGRATLTHQNLLFCRLLLLALIWNLLVG